LTAPPIGGIINKRLRKLNPPSAGKHSASKQK